MQEKTIKAYLRNDVLNYYLRFILNSCKLRTSNLFIIDIIELLYPSAIEYEKNLIGKKFEKKYFANNSLWLKNFLMEKYLLEKKFLKKNF